MLLELQALKKQEEIDEQLAKSKHHADIRETSGNQSAHRRIRNC